MPMPMPALEGSAPSDSGSGGAFIKWVDAAAAAKYIVKKIITELLYSDICSTYWVGVLYYVRVIYIVSMYLVPPISYPPIYLGR